MSMPSVVIKGEQTDNLQISEDTDLENQPIAVFLYTPTMLATSNHYHIEMGEEEADKLHKWLGEWLTQRKTAKEAVTQKAREDVYASMTPEQQWEFDKRQGRLDDPE